MAFAAATLALAFLFFRAPEPASSAANSSYRMLLDVAFRPAAPSTLPVQTLDGPLVPLQNPVYVGRSVWRPIVWQFLGNLAVGAILGAAALRQSATRAWWAIGGLIVLGIVDSSLGPWCAIFVLGLFASGLDNRLLRLFCGIGIGLLAATSIPHFLLGCGAIVLPLLRRSAPALRQAEVASGFVLGLAGLWFLLGQSLGKLGHWLWFGLTGAWTPSELTLSPTAAKTFPWIVLAWAVWGSALFFRRNLLRTQPTLALSAWLVTWGLFLAWKLVAMQPAGSPLLFFATAILGGFLLLDLCPAAAAPLFVIGVIGAAVPDRTLMSDAVGRINRQVLRNFDELRQLGSLRERLRQDFTGYGASFAMPLTRAALAGGPVGIVGDEGMQAVLNELRITLAPGFSGAGARDDAGARAHAEALLQKEAPPFSLHRIDRDTNLLPGLRDGPAQLALYRGYEFLLHEQGVSLWKKRSEPMAGPLEIVQSGKIAFGEKISLPASDDTYWLELDCSPNLAGHLRDLVHPLVEPALRVTGTDGQQLRYALAWRMARAGFLVRPFLNGDLGWLKFEEGEPNPPIDSVTVELPSSGQSLWRSQISYRLYRLPGLISARKPSLSAALQKQYAALNRLPASVSCPFPPLFGLVQAEPSLFMHPNSALELVARATDRTIEGSYGIAPGAYANSGPNVTDGVAFTIEFLAASGEKTLLLERYLDPVANTEDRGPQRFRVKIPSSTGGRLIFRTFNLPHKTSSFDWSYWREIVLK